MYSFFIDIFFLHDTICMGPKMFIEFFQKLNVIA